MNVLTTAASSYHMIRWAKEDEEGGPSLIEEDIRSGRKEG